MADDPIVNLLGELLSAHDRMLAGERVAAGEQRGAAGERVAAGGRAVDRLQAALRRRRHRTVAALSAGVLLLTASATAAVLIVSASRPLAGRLPPELLGTRYALRVTPDLQAGRAGWCVSLLDIGPDETVVPIPQECVSGSGPLIARGGLVVLSPHTGAERGRLLYAIVDRRVRSLQTPDGARIRPIRSAALPPGWRAAVTIQKHPAAAEGAHAAAPIELNPLGAGGRRLSTRAGAPLAVATRTVRGSHPPRTGCRMRVRPWPGLGIGQGRAASPPHLGGVAGSGGAGSGGAGSGGAGSGGAGSGVPGLFSCYTLNIDLGASVSVAAVLVRTSARRGAAGPIPGFVPLRSHPGVWIGPASTAQGPDTGLLQRLFARRVGGGWLVLQTPASQSVALVMLQHIRAAV